MIWAIVSSWSYFCWLYRASPSLAAKNMLLLSRFSRVWLSATLWTEDHQAPLSMGFSRQEYWSGLPFPSPAKNIINLILVLTICWCPCVESSLVLLEEGVCYDQCVLLAKLCLCSQAKPLTSFVLNSKAKFACYSRYLLTLGSWLLDSWLQVSPTFAFQSPIMKRTSLWGVSYRRSCRFS